MSSRLENYIEDRTVTWAERELNVESVKLNIQGNRGYPDRLFLLPLRPALIEFKRPGETLRKLQAYRVNQLRRLYYDVLATDSIGEACQWLKDLYTARLSEAGDKANDFPSVRRTALASWLREDKYNSGRAQNPKR